MGFLFVLSSLLWFLLVLVPTSAKIPEGYSLQVVPNCGSDGVENASISITTDIELIRLTAECANGVHEFQQTSFVQSDLVISYPPSETGNCVFFKRAQREVYYVRVSVAWSKVATDVQQTKTVTCSFSPHADNYSLQNDVIEGFFAPTELKSLKGPSSSVPMSLILTDVLGHNITGTAIKMGKTIQIRLEATNASGILGIYPISCVAVGNGKRYAILRIGCGDGVVFKKNVGFKTSGLVSRSPYFKAFAVGQSTDLKIRCNVTICATGCDGDTCKNQRRRRSVEYDEGFRGYIPFSTTQQLVETPLHFDVDWNTLQQDVTTYISKIKAIIGLR